MREVLRVGRIRIDPIELDEAVDLVLDAKRRVGVHLCNAATVAEAGRDPDLATLLSDADVLLADGAPLVWLARHHGAVAPTSRVYGPDLMLRSIDRGRARRTRHFLLGTTPDTLARLERELLQRFPGVELVGSWAPPFGEPGPAEIACWAERVTISDADVVWVGLGAPRQDRVVRSLMQHVDATCVAVGAAFDFIAGTKPQAPRWLGRLGLEWLFRFVSEPRRLWRRYLLGNLAFLATVFRGHVHLQTEHDAPAPRPAPTRASTGELRYTGRLLDVLVGLPLALVAAPIVGALLVASFVQFRASPLFVQPRVGRHGRIIRIAKVRTLHPSTAPDLDKVDLPTEAIPRWSRFIRDKHLDELPQLWSVLAGTMSLVGPRPELPRLLDRYEGEVLARRHEVRPGLTGLWQVSSDVVRPIYAAPEHDLRYVATRSLRLDLQILWVTFAGLLRTRGMDRPPEDRAGIPNSRSSP
jgi:N-acetylglucosaminyldiphosphoundecaprenol N-acetyl-beta-D-mannosaminyltransferase